jgi:hypothetical protein
MFAYEIGLAISSFALLLVAFFVVANMASVKGIRKEVPVRVQK